MCASREASRLARSGEEPLPRCAWSRFLVACAICVQPEVSGGHMRLTRSIYGVAGVLVCLGVGSSVARGAGSSGAAGGPIHIFVQPGHGQGNGKIVITGAIGDYGVTRQVRGGGGKRLATAKLRKGTVTFDLTAINDKLNSTTPTFDKATCSASISASAPVPVVRGTGRYAGIR